MGSKYAPIISGESTFGMGYIPTCASNKQTANGPSHIDYDVENIVNAMQDMPAGREYSIYKFITELKADLGIVSMTDMFDCFYMLAGPSERDTYINWAQPGTYDITLIGATGTGGNNLSFVQNVGWNSVGITNTTSTLNTNFNPYGILSNFGNKNEIWSSSDSGLSNAGGSYGLYYGMKNKALAFNKFEFGAATLGAGTGTLFNALNTANSVTYNLLSTNTTVAQSSISLTLTNIYPSLFTVIRQSNKTLDLYNNGELKVSVNSSGAITTAVDVGPYCICNPNVASSPVGGTAVNLSHNLSSFRQVSFCYIGSRDIKPDIIYKRLKEYFHATGYDGTNITQTQ